MNAKEMFEELGYEYEKSDKYIRCTWRPKNNHYCRTITFDLKNKKFKPYNQVQFTMNLFKAVCKQVEELGW